MGPSVPVAASLPASVAGPVGAVPGRASRAAVLSTHSLRRFGCPSGSGWVILATTRAFSTIRLPNASLSFER